MSDSIQQITTRIFGAFGFYLEKRASSGPQQIQKVLEASLKSPVVAISTKGPSFAAVDATPRVKRAEVTASEYAVRLHREIYNKPVIVDKTSEPMYQQRVDLAKYLLASALLFSKLQEDPIKCQKILSALSKTSLEKELDQVGYENFGLVFGNFSSLSDQERIEKFELLRTGAKKEGENSCHQFGQLFSTSQIRKTWSQNFATMMECFENDAKVLSCLKKK